MTHYTDEQNQMAEEAVEFTNTAYSFDRYSEKEWFQIARFLLTEGYNFLMVVEILKSKFMRWGADYQGPTLTGFKKYFLSVENHTGNVKKDIEHMLINECSFDMKSKTRPLKVLDLATVVARAACPSMKHTPIVVLEPKEILSTKDADCLEASLNRIGFSVDRSKISLDKTFVNCDTAEEASIFSSTVTDNCPKFKAIIF